MSRLIEARFGTWAPASPIAIRVGDVLRFAASGGRVRDGSAVELLGIFTEALVGTDGTALTPMGAPNVVLFRARLPGRGTIEVVTADPWRQPTQTSTVMVVVE